MWTREQFEAALVEAEIKLAWMRGSGDMAIPGWFNRREQQLEYIGWLESQLEGGPYLLVPQERDPLDRSEGGEKL